MIKDKKNLNVSPLRFPEFEGEWKTDKLASLVNVVGGGTPDIANFDLWDGDINWFTPTEIGHCKYISSSKRKINNLG